MLITAAFAGHAQARRSRPPRRSTRKPATWHRLPGPGQGELDIVFVPGVISHLDLLWEDAATSGFYPPARHARPTDHVVEQA